MESPPESRLEPSSSDAELLYALQKKQPAALSMLYERYGGVVYGVALKMLQNPQEAEDLAQDIFLSLWRNAAGPAKAAHFVNYLVVMTRSRAIDKLRTRTRNFSLLQRWRQTASTEPALPTPFEQASLTERSQRVQEAVAQLSDQQRQVIEMAYNNGLSQSEIAQQLNIPLGTVKSWTRKGLLRLRQILQDSIE